MTDSPAPEPDRALFDDDADDADQSAEMDSSVPSDSAATEPLPATDDLFTGMCVGGPYGGRRVSSRFPDGFLLYDKTRSCAWTYRADPDDAGQFVVQGQATVVLSPQNLRPIADGVQYDVLAYDPQGPAAS